MAIVGKRSVGEIIFDSANMVLLLCICTVTIYPFLYIIAVSLSARGPVMRGEVFVLPIGINVKSYIEVLKNEYIFISYGNTIFVVVIGTFLSLVFTALAAYPLSKRFLVGRKVFLFIMAITLWFNAGMIPRFLVIRNLGLLDRLWAVILGPLMSAFYIIVMRSFFENLPESLEDSARIDGASYWTVLLRIVVPLSKPVLATIALWKSVQYWNMFMAPLLYLKSSDKYTLQLILRDIVIAATGIGFGQEGIDQEFEVVGETVRAATILVATIPILMIYPFVQKYFVKGALIGSVKG
jgi:putative aldouronate transport system permease protein